MKKMFIDEKVGTDGARVQFGVDEADIKFQATFPLKVALDKGVKPIIIWGKNMIPGERWDYIPEKLYGMALDFLGLKADEKTQLELPVDQAAQPAPAQPEQPAKDEAEKPADNPIPVV